MMILRKLQFRLVYNFIVFDKAIIPGFFCVCLTIKDKQYCQKGCLSKLLTNADLINV